MGGLELRFLQTKEGTAGSLDAFEMTVQPNARMPVAHYHESWDETIYGLPGAATWVVDGRDLVLMPGQSVFIKRGIVHSFRNDTQEPASCLCILTPGVLGPGYFREIAAVLAGGALDPARMKEIMLRRGLGPAPQLGTSHAPKMLGDGIDVLVAAARQVQHHQVVLRTFRRELENLGQGVRGLERRDDAFELRAELEGVERFLVGRRKIGHPSHVVEPRMLGPDARIVEPGGDRMSLEDLAVLGLQKISAVAVQHARAPAIDRGRVAIG